MKQLVVKKGTYRDSITLLRISKGVEKVEGVIMAAVVMGTPLNKRVLSEVGFTGPEIKSTGADDLVVAVEAKNSASLESAVKETERLLTSQETEKSAKRLPRSLAEALAMNREVNLALISVPGGSAKHEALAALNAGLNVFVFSSNVSREDERELKQLALQKGLLMMGPDCGSAIINHVVLGFGNKVREGSIGIVSASGTGLQEVSTLIHRAGLGISQAIGTGGGDLSDTVGGIMTLQAMKLLDEDPKTNVIVVISKPPGPKTLASVLPSILRASKPVVLNFLGADLSRVKAGRHVAARTLEEAASLAVKLAGKEPQTQAAAEERSVAFTEASKLAKQQRFVRGLFSGGTLCYEAMVVLSPLIGEVYSNAPLDKKLWIKGASRSRLNTCVDMGAEDFVVGRAHPMIDFTLRKMRILEEAKDPGTAVILLDVELGLGSNPDPAGELVPAIVEAKTIASRAGRYMSVVASVVGTEGDFQNLQKQEKTLRGVEVVLSRCNASAAALAALIATRGEAPKVRPS